MKPVCFPLSLLLALGGLLLARPAGAQTAPPAPADSARISYGEETVPDSVAFGAAGAADAGERGTLERQLRKFTRVQIEEHRLWKLGLTHFGYTSLGRQLWDSRYGFDLIYERKLGTAWAVLAEASPEYLRYREEYRGPVRAGLGAEAQLAGRYYYNLKKRIRKGRSASNFSANYLSLALGAGFGRRGYGTPFENEGVRGHPVRATAAAVFGLQRRLGRYGFVDFNAGLPLPLAPRPGPFFANNTVRILLNIRLGLALGR